MQSPVPVNGPLEGVRQCLDFPELVLLECLVDAHDVLPDNSSGANVQVADFRITHQTLWEADGEGRSFKLGVALGGL